MLKKIYKTFFLKKKNNMTWYAWIGQFLKMCMINRIIVDVNDHWLKLISLKFMDVSVAHSHSDFLRFSIVNISFDLLVWQNF